MTVFTNKLFSTGSVFLSKEADSMNNFMSMSFDSNGNVTASLVGAGTVDRRNGDGGNDYEVGDVELRFGSTWVTGRSQESDFSIKRRYVNDGGRSGYELRIARTSHEGYDKDRQANWFEADTDVGIAYRVNDNVGAAGGPTPFRIGGGLTESPMGSSGLKDEYATLVVSASQQGTNYMRTILRLDNGTYLGSNGGVNSYYGSHQQFLMGDAYSSDPAAYGTGFGTNMWMGNYDYIPKASGPAQDWRGCFYIAYGDVSTRMEGMEPPKLGSQFGQFADGACWLMSTASESGGTGGGQIAPKLRVGDSYRGTTARGSQMIFPSSSLHVLGDGSDTNNMLFSSGYIVDNRDYVAQFETVAIQSYIGTSLIGIKAGSYNRGDGQENGSGYPTKMTIAMGAINYTAGKYADPTDFTGNRLECNSGDFWVGITQPEAIGAKQKGPQTRMMLTASGSLNIFSGSNADTSPHLQFPPKPGYLNNPIDASCQFIPSGTINMWGGHAVGTSPGDFGYNSPAVMNFINYTSALRPADSYCDSGDILGRIAFRSFGAGNVTGESGYDGLGCYVEARVSANWGIKDWNTDLDFYTRADQGRPERVMTLGAYGDLTLGGTPQTTYKLKVDGLVGIESGLYHIDDTNTFMAFTVDQIELEAGGHTAILLNEDGSEPTTIVYDNLTVSGSLPQLRLQGSNTTASSGPELIFRRTTTEVDGITSGDNLGEIWFYGSENGTQFSACAAIVGEADGDFTYSTDAPGRLTFYTTPDSSVSVTERMRITRDGSVVIGYAGDPSGFAGSYTGLLAVKRDAAASYCADLWADGNATNRWSLRCMGGTDDNSGSNTHIQFADGDGGLIGAITSTGGTVTYGPFTGIHYCGLPEGINSYPYGTILKILSTSTTREKQISYLCGPTSTAVDKTVFGIYAVDMVGSPSEDEKHQVFCLGDGHILVCSEGGNIELGDYICSSNTQGHGMKQSDDLLHNYTVAKATEPVDWSNEPDTTKLISCTYHAS